MDSYNIFSMLGEGGFGKVYLATDKTSNQPIALKIISKNCETSNIKDLVENETKIHQKLVHLNIIELLNFFENDDYFCVAMEYASGKDLYKKLKKLKKFNETDTKSYINQIALAVEYLHDNFIIHCDLKPENILLDKNNIVKICDFGWATEFSPINEKVKFSCSVGTLDYLSPELVEYKDFDKQIDVWSLGVLTFEFLTGRPPFYNISISETYNNITNVSYNILSNDMSLKAICFIKQLLKYKPNERLTIKEILSHEFLF